MQRHWGSQLVLVFITYPYPSNSEAIDNAVFTMIDAGTPPIILIGRRNGLSMVSVPKNFYIAYGTSMLCIMV